jgi:hypothetical protein
MSLGQEAGVMYMKLGTKPPNLLTDGFFPVKEDMLSFCTEETRDLEYGQFPVSSTQKET